MFIQFPLAEIIFPNLYVEAMNIILYIMQQGRGEKKSQHIRKMRSGVLLEI